MSVALPHDVIDMWRTLIISLLCSVTLPVIVAQPCRVQGVVIDADSALPGVNVALAGTTTGTSTDAQGRFKLDIAQAGRQVIRFSFLGYGTMERTISSEPGRTIDLGTITLTRNASELGEVVVSGTLSAISRDASPVPVEVITPLLFRHNPEPNLIGSIGMVNGVRPQINCSVCNTGDIHINGMEGPYTMVLIDGMPIVSSLGTVYGLSGIPTSLIERVEIVKGPGSALYGSEAMGGIINVITKDPVLAPRLALDLSVTTWSEYNADLGIKLGNDRFSDLIGVNVFSYGDPRDDNGDGFTDLTLQQRISVFNKIALRRPERKAASLATRYLTEDRWGGADELDAGVRRRRQHLWREHQYEPLGGDRAIPIELAGYRHGPVQRHWPSPALVLWRNALQRGPGRVLRPSVLGPKARAALPFPCRTGI